MFSFLAVGGEWVGKCWTWRECADISLQAVELVSSLLGVPGASESWGWNIPSPSEVSWA